MKILSVCQEYPSADRPAIMAFVHTRNVYMRQSGLQVEVLSFACKEAYEWDGVRVAPATEFDSNKIAQFDICYNHAPNLRNGLRFVFAHRKFLNKMCFVIHGHEFLDWMNYTPTEYPFMRSLKCTIRGFAQSIYDKVKLRIWNAVLRTVFGRKIGIIFVSNWMKKHSEKCLSLGFDRAGIKNAVIENPIHPAFTGARYQPGEIRADFVTIRPFDYPKYAIDLVTEIARRNPDKTFHVFGHGRYFDFFPPPPNMQVFHKSFRQEELPELLGHYRCALLPTRVDAQGVLMCEVASLGMPILTSDLEICREMLGGFSNAGFFSNETLQLGPALPQVNPQPPRHRFFLEETITKELDFARTLPNMSTAPSFQTAMAVSEIRTPQN